VLFVALSILLFRVSSLVCELGFTKLFLVVFKVLIPGCFLVLSNYFLSFCWCVLELPVAGDAAQRARLNRLLFSLDVVPRMWHVPGLALVAEGVDGASRGGGDLGDGCVDYILGPAVGDELWEEIETVLRRIGCGITIDLFATASNAKCARYFSRTHEPGAERTDAFTMLDWMPGVPADPQGGGVCLSADDVGQARGEQGDAWRGKAGVGGTADSHSAALAKAKEILVDRQCGSVLAGEER
jgi:hypothetical protein